MGGGLWILKKHPTISQIVHPFYLMENNPEFIYWIILGVFPPSSYKPKRSVGTKWSYLQRPYFSPQ